MAEKVESLDPENLAQIGRFNVGSNEPARFNSNVDITPFIGRIGAHGESNFVTGHAGDKVLQTIPDAAPLMTFDEIFDLRPFATLCLWRSAMMEGMATLMLVWITMYANLAPASIPNAPDSQLGAFDNASFIGPLVGGILNFFFLTIFTFCFGAISGAHLNPTITIATFFTRLCSFPRMVLYVTFQTGGAALGGLLARSSYGSRDFQVGGCWIYTDVVPIGDAFTVELMACTTLLFFAFGVGLDPRQRQVVGPTLGPFLVGLSLASLSFGTGYTRYGYGGSSMNPARCFGTYVGSRFPSYHWIHWVADIIACGIHAVFYHLAPPWKATHQK